MTHYLVLAHDSRGQFLEHNQIFILEYFKPESKKQNIPKLCQKE
jgi:hypothetical protein